MPVISVIANEPLSKFITIADFCDMFKVSRTQFYRLVNDRQIPLFKIGRMSRIKVEDAQNWVASLQEKAVA